MVGFGVQSTSDGWVWSAVHVGWLGLECSPPRMVGFGVQSTTKAAFRCAKMDMSGDQGQLLLRLVPMLTGLGVVVASAILAKFLLDSRKKKVSPAWQ